MYLGKNARTWVHIQFSEDRESNKYWASMKNEAKLLNGCRFPLPFVGSEKNGENSKKAGKNGEWNGQANGVSVSVRVQATLQQINVLYLA